MRRFEINMISLRFVQLRLNPGNSEILSNFIKEEKNNF